MDWSGEHHAGSIPFLRMDEYIREYRSHPEGKAGDLNGNRAGTDARGVLRRLSVTSIHLARIGKEIDRLGEDEGASLEGSEPKEYIGAGRQDLADAIAFLASFPPGRIAHEIGLSPRRWSDIVKSRAKPRSRTAKAITLVAANYRAHAAR